MWQFTLCGPRVLAHPVDVGDVADAVVLRRAREAARAARLQLAVGAPLPELGLLCVTHGAQNQRRTEGKCTLRGWAVCGCVAGSFEASGILIIIEARSPVPQLEGHERMLPYIGSISSPRPTDLHAPSTACISNIHSLVILYTWDLACGACTP